LPAKKRAKSAIEQEEIVARSPPSGNFLPHYLETEIDGERIGLTLWDSEGLEKNVVDLQLREMAGFLESKFDETFNEEMKVVRSPGVQDTHIHAVFLILDPARLDRNIASSKAAGANGHHANGKYAVQSRTVGGLDEDLDLQVLRTLQGKTTVIPVISKADTITTKHMNVLKRTVWDSLKKANLDPLEALGLEDDDASANSGNDRIEEADEDAYEGSEDEVETPGLPIQGGGFEPSFDPSASPESKGSKRMSTQEIRRNQAEQGELKEDEVPYIPMSIISPDIYEPGVVGRQFPWGFADPNNEEHCDFLRLKDAVFSEWRAELREVSREQWYEGWRTSRLKNRDTSRAASVRR
jgi:septin family protein